ncbi:2OG-Fe(II) oxygenase [Sulfurimonas microaerophilic]|uniref:2OG-Fe(II) oxygenase n=1 Tax=Sulfurimonas microaerophilic TaxID=3058392 RepID=UPI002715183C|nr:2OG-Fe(II) oxygenase [Sulfurimonas sp. hsl 1-7]
MIQISENIFLDKHIFELDIPTAFLPSPYKQFPFLVIKNFLKLHELPLFVNDIYEDEDAEIAKVKSEVILGVVEPKVVKKYRDTKIYTISEYLNNLYHLRFQEYQSQIEDYFNIAITLSTELQALEYKKGGFYVQHADDSNAIVDENKNIIAYHPVAPQRKITTVLFATSYSENPDNKHSFKGGELVFNFLKDKDGKTIEFKADAGDMIIFPSNPYFSHEVKEVEAGYRLTLVQWHNAILN